MKGSSPLRQRAERPCPARLPRDERRQVRFGTIWTDTTRHELTGPDGQPESLKFKRLG